MSFLLKSVLVALIGALALCSDARAVLTFEVSGTYDTHGETVFGENGNAIPYFFQFTGDTDVMTLLHHIPAWTEVDGRQTTGDWYGYDSAGITLLAATFGTVDWTLGGTMEDLSPGPGYTAKLWVDAPVTTTNQSVVWMQFYRGDVEGTLEIGRQGVSDFFTFLLNESTVTAPDFYQADSTSMTVTVVPEPSTVASLVVGLAGMLGLGRWRRGSRGGAEKALRG